MLAKNPFHGIFDAINVAYPNLHIQLSEYLQKWDDASIFSILLAKVIVFIYSFIRKNILN